MEGCIGKRMPRQLMLSFKSLPVLLSPSPQLAYCLWWGWSLRGSTEKWVVMPGMEEGKQRNGFDSRQHLIFLRPTWNAKQNCLGWESTLSQILRTLLSVVTVLIPMHPGKKGLLSRLSNCSSPAKWDCYTLRPLSRGCTQNRRFSLWHRKSAHL